MRKLFKNLHYIPALILGLPIALICFTGGILVFEKDFYQWQAPELYHIENPAKNVIPLPELLDMATVKLASQFAIDKPIAAVTVGNADTPYLVSVKGVKKRWSVNQYTGEVIGEHKRSAFFTTVIYLHRFLLDAPEKKGQMTAGRMFIGISTLFMIVILLSSIKLWWPKTLKGLKNRLSICCTKGWKRFQYDVHVAGGFYMNILLLLMCVTGLVWSFDWWRNIMYALVTSPEHEAMVKQTAQAAQNQLTIVGYEGLRIIHTNVDLPWSVGKLMHELHYGTWAGIFSKILYFIAMIVGTALPITGYWMWYKKKRSQHKKAAKLNASASTHEVRAQTLHA